MSDLISKEEAIDGVIKSCFGKANVVQAEAAAIQYITRIPSAQGRKTGQWEEIEVITDAHDISGVKTWASRMRCNMCGFIITAIEGHIAQYEYCPNCGARMVRGESREPDKR